MNIIKALSTWKNTLKEYSEEDLLRITTLLELLNKLKLSDRAVFLMQHKILALKLRNSWAQMAASLEKEFFSLNVTTNVGFAGLVKSLELVEEKKS